MAAIAARWEEARIAGGKQLAEFVQERKSSTVFFLCTGLSTLQVQSLETPLLCVFWARKPKEIAIARADIMRYKTPYKYEDILEGSSLLWVNNLRYLGVCDFWLYISLQFQ